MILVKTSVSKGCIVQYDYSNCSYIVAICFAIVFFEALIWFLVL